MPTLVERKPPLLCSFCGKSEDDVQGIVAGVVASICNECVAVAMDEIERQTKGRTPGPRVTVDGPPPHGLTAKEG